jgi:hypothetical protein
MREWFDIFQVDLLETPMWIDAAESLQSAEGRVAELMKVKRFDFLIYSQKTGEKWVIPCDGRGATAAGGNSGG